MPIKHMIVHKIISQQHDPLVETIARERAIALPDDRADSLLAAVLDSYGRDRDALAYAGFKDGEWFPVQLRAMVDGDANFYDFSVEGLDRLRQQMMRVPASTGGYLTYIRYAQDDTDYLMVILLKDRAGIGITSELNLEDVQSLDLDNLHFAARIDFQRWFAEDVNERKNHVSFLKGRRRTEVVVNYFKAFLGVDEDMYSDPARNTSDIVNAVLNFAVEFVPLKEKNLAVNRVYDYAIERVDNMEPIALAQVSNLVSPDDPERFINYMIEKQKEVPGEFRPTKKALDRLVNFRIKTTNYYLSFERSAIENGTIWLNNNGNLEIGDVPDWVRDQLLG